MDEQKYYKQIKELIETYEVNSKVRYMQDNHEKLLTNWKIGKINHMKSIEGLVEWKRFAEDVEALLKKISANYYIKNSLRNL